MKNRLLKTKAPLLRAVAVSLALMGAGTLVVGCTKAKTEKSMVDTSFYVPKSDFEGKTFSLVRGIEEADSSNVVGAVPGFSQDYGLVTVRITEREIQFVEVFNPETRAETRTILASFPIVDHFDIQREENDFKEKTHRIVENRERPWQQRAYMRVDWTRPSNALSSLSRLADDLTAREENIVLLETPKNESGHISWLTEFSLKAAPPSWLPYDPYMGSRVVARTHLVPLKASDYQPVNYREKDFSRFGYFFTMQQFEDPEKGLLDKDLENHTFALMHNVCEPGRKSASGQPLSCSTNKVSFKLTKGFPARFVPLARQAVQEWNQTFKTALGRSDDVVVLDESAQVDLIDPRQHTLAFYEPKSPGGLLGVAQWMSNPMTGELIAVRATVYQDGIRGTLGWVDEIIDLILADERFKEMFLKVGAPAHVAQGPAAHRGHSHAEGPSVREQLNQLHRALKMSDVRSANRGVSLRQQKQQLRTALAEPRGRGVERKRDLMRKAPELFQVADLERIGGRIAAFEEVFDVKGARSAQAQTRAAQLGGLEHLHEFGAALRQEKALAVQQAATGIHGQELVEEAAVRYIQRVLERHPNLQDFAAQRSVIRDEVEKLTFYSTMLHEMGHTFGLRHNFEGSADQRHYHPEYRNIMQKLAAGDTSVKPDDLEPYAYSSIMDYGGDFYSQAGGLGPYDKAAIRYAYNRGINKESDPVVQARFAFCTDHEVNESITCRRFDKGSNVSMITQSLIDRFERNWLLSHTRRGRANFERIARNYPMRALVNYMIPIRQVMDEMIFSLITSPTVPAQQGQCDSMFMRISVEQGEIANICDPMTAERAGVDPTDIGTFENALFNEKGEFRKPPMSYVPGGLADLLFSNAMAKIFFANTIGSTEPGTFLAIPTQSGEVMLERLGAGGTDEEKLAAFAEERGINDPRFLEQAKNFIGELELGRYGRPFMSSASSGGAWTRQENIGSFWDKYVAMIALGIKDIGVDKYSQISMTGNAYSYPQTRTFTTRLFDALVNQKGRVASVPLKLRSGQTVMGMVEASMNRDTQAIATVTSLTDFVADGDESVIDKMRVCSTNERGCLTSMGQRSVEFTSASGQDQFRAVQTLQNDSIAFSLVSSAAEIAKQRDEWLEKQRKANDQNADNLMKLSEGEGRFVAYAQALSRVPELAQAAEALVGVQGRDPGAWGLMKTIVGRVDQLPLFTTINFAQEAAGRFVRAQQAVTELITAMGDTGRCGPPNAPANSRPGNAGRPNPGTAPAQPGAGQPNNITAPGVSPGSVTGLATGEPLDGAAPVVVTPPATAPVNAACEQTPEAQKRRELETLKAQAEDMAKLAVEVMSSTLDGKVAPLRVRRLSDEIARAEANIRLIRRVMKATGAD
jgi:hypothetical protein